MYILVFVRILNHYQTMWFSLPDWFLEYKLCELYCSRKQRNLHLLSHFFSHHPYEIGKARDYVLSWQMVRQSQCNKMIYSVAQTTDTLKYLGFLLAQSFIHVSTLSSLINPKCTQVCNKRNNLLWSLIGLCIEEEIREIFTFFEFWRPKIHPFLRGGLVSFWDWEESS